jgi:hypothetical protein
MAKSRDEYRLFMVMEHPDGGLDKVYKPVLSKDEYERRFEMLKEATKVFMKAVEKEN